MPSEQAPTISSMSMPCGCEVEGFIGRRHGGRMSPFERRMMVRGRHALNTISAEFLYVRWGGW